jgi:ADP-ribose pyrophosphatase YjhB (NUDIX family)
VLLQDPTTRDFTATTFVVHQNQTLLLWHNKVQAWLPPGGHLNPNELPEEAAVREVLEETGLEVELLGEHHVWGEVRVLRTPVCILLEDISPGHQHIDMIYFARPIGGKLQINTRESAGFRWYGARELETPEIGEDIRLLGRQAIEQAVKQVYDMGNN